MLQYKPVETNHLLHIFGVEVERAKARLVFLARAGETSKARLGSSRQFELNPMARSSRLADFSLSLGSSRLEPAKILARSTSSCCASGCSGANYAQC